MSEKKFEWTDELVKEYEYFLTCGRFDLKREEFKEFKKQQLQRIPLFTTEDGVQMFEGMSCYEINKEFSNSNHPITSWTQLPKTLEKISWDMSKCLYFSSRKAAEDYLKSKEKKFTEKEMENCFNAARITLYPDVLNEKVFKYQSYFDYKL